jgi:beta-phosphoglucomutase
VIFDMDGVLVDSYAAHLESWNVMLGHHGLAMTEEQFAATFGRTTREIIRHLFPGAADEEQIAAWDREKEAAYRGVIEREFPEMDGAGELIRSLHAAGFALGIGSSGPAENVAVVQRCLPDGGLIAATVHGMEVARGKPEPDVFVKVAEKLGVAPARCAVVEDAPAGVEAARRANMVAIALTGTAPRETLAQRAHVVVDSLRELTPQRIADLIDTHNAD